MRSRYTRLSVLDELEDRCVPSFAEFLDPHPSPGNQFGGQVVPLSTGNVVVTSTYDDTGGNDAGAVYLFNGKTGELISEFLGGQAGDYLGGDGIIPLTNGNFVIKSPKVSFGALRDAGAVTWASGITGISGVVSKTNSLVGSSVDDGVGGWHVLALPNGNYVVSSPDWDNGTIQNAGAVTWGNGQTGITGVISPLNSLVGTTKNDRVGDKDVAILANGNYVVSSPFWDNTSFLNAGAATWADGAKGIAGPITSGNSLVGANNNDQISLSGVRALTNGNYVVISPAYNDPVNSLTRTGAATWGDGTKGIAGPISPLNSLIGLTNDDNIGSGGVVPLPNGHFVIISPHYDFGPNAEAGAVTWGNGKGGTVGRVNVTNSYVGRAVNDQVGSGGVVPLTNGNFVVLSPEWNNGAAFRAGAVTWGNGQTGISGQILPDISIVGSKLDDHVGNGGAVALTNGNYVVVSNHWDNGNVIEAGAVTWADGTGRTKLVVSSDNSVAGSTILELTGARVFPLTNGNYIISYFGWDNGTVVDAGFVSWRDGTKALSGTISPLNSLVGTSTGDHIGVQVVALSNGNAVVYSQNWKNGTISNAGAVTWIDGTKGLTGAVTAANSLVGSQKGDAVGTQVLALTNGNYVTISSAWSSVGTPAAGAVTWGNGKGGTVGPVSPSNSLIGGSSNAIFGLSDIFRLSNGHYVALTPQTDNGSFKDAGAATWGDGTTGIIGTISKNNSLLGTATWDPNNGTLANGPSEAVEDLINRQFYISFAFDGGGHVRVGRTEGLTDSPEFGVGAAGKVSLHNRDASERFSLSSPFGDFKGDIRIAAADFNGDGIADLVVGTGPGRTTQVKIFDGVTKAVLFSVDPFEAQFTGGVYISANDLTGDGIADLVITPDEGGGPRARIFNGSGFAQIADFFGIDDPNFRGGARSAVGDLNGDGIGDLIVVAGFGGGPRVAAFDGSKLTTRGGPKLFGDFFAFEQSLRNGIFVAAGDVNGDGFADIVAGGGPGGGPRVFVLNGRELVQNGTDKLASIGNFFAGNVQSRGGIRLAVKNLDGDQKADIVVGAGEHAGSTVTAYLGSEISPTGGTPIVEFTFNAFADFNGGVFVG